jgi:hypothetical protein
MAGTCKRQSELLESGIGELSLLPLFLDLKGKKALVIGTSQGARWKAELLRAAGALVQQLDRPPVVENALCEYSFIIADIAVKRVAKFAKEARATVLPSTWWTSLNPASFNLHYRQSFAGRQSISTSV